MTRIGKGKFMQDTVGIDVSKATLDAFWLSGTQHQAFSNDQPGLKLLLRWIGKSKAALTVFEATGAYDRQLQAQLAAHDLPFESGPRSTLDQYGYSRFAGKPLLGNGPRRRYQPQSSFPLGPPSGHKGPDWSCRGLVPVSFEQCLL